MSTRMTFGLLFLGAVILWLAASVAPLVAASTNAAPLQPAPPASDADFGQYLASHEDALAPFFSSHSDELVKESIPFFFAVMGNVLFLNVVIGWIIDVAAGRGFSIFYAPTRAKIKPAIIYGTARLLLVVGLTVLGSLAAVFVALLHTPTNLIVFLGFLFLLDFLLEVCLVCIVYGTSAIVAALFFLGLLTVHFILGTALTGALIEMRVISLGAEFVDQKVAPQVNDAVMEEKHELETATSARDAAKAKTADLQNRLAQAKADQEQLGREIDQKKNSEAYLFSRIVRVRAQGDNASARDQFIAFLAKYPNGSMADAAKTQLAGINSDMATQEAQKKQAAADAAAAIAQARADLLARAGKGEATLSELREALIGKTREEVKALFGDPSDVASDRWGYSPPMVFNPLTGEKHGLAIYFSEGTVLSVDFYYGNGGAK